MWYSWHSKRRFKKHSSRHSTDMVNAQFNVQCEWARTAHLAEKWWINHPIIINVITCCCVLLVPIGTRARAYVWPGRWRWRPNRFVGKRGRRRTCVAKGEMSRASDLLYSDSDRNLYELHCSVSLTISCIEQCATRSHDATTRWSNFFHSFPLFKFSVGDSELHSLCFRIAHSVGERNGKS